MARSITMSVTAMTLNTTLSCYVEPVSALPGEQVSIFAQLLDQTGAPVRLKPINFYANSVLIGTVPTSYAAPYVAILNWAPPSAGIYSIYAEFLGDATYNPSTSTMQTLTVAKWKTSMTISVSPTSVVVGQTVTISGVITDEKNYVVPGVDVNINIGGVIVATVKTDASGYYSYDWTPSSAGTFSIYAEFLGTAIHEGCEETPD